MIRSLSFEKLGNIQNKEKQKTTLPSGPYWDDIIIPYQENLNLKEAKDFNRIIAIHAFPFENMKHLKFERRQGSDLSAFVFQKNLKNTYLTSRGIDDNLFVSFLSFYEVHPLKIVTHKTKDLGAFYREKYFEDLKTKLDNLKEQEFSVMSMMFLGNIFALHDHLPRFLGMFKSTNPEKCVVLMVSPLQQTEFKNKWKEVMPCRFLHLGLDDKFYVDDQVKNEKDIELVRDIVNGVEKEVEMVKDLVNQVRKGDVQNLHIIWDCEIFASDFFPGKFCLGFE
jgi:hypothetical protein